LSKGCRALCNSKLSPSASSRFTFRGLQPRSRSPYDFVNPRAVLISDVRVRTSPARARMTVRSACAFRLRCCTGPSRSGSIRASRARVRASKRSSFRRLSPIKRTFRAWATITSCSNSLNRRLTHGECIPVSNAIRLRGIPPKTSFIAFSVVASFRSRSTSPAASRTQYQLDRSPRSRPTVNLCPSIFPILRAAAVLTFFIAGLLISCASSASITWERIASRRRPAFSSHLLTTIKPCKVCTQRERRNALPKNQAVFNASSKRNSACSGLRDPSFARSNGDKYRAVYGAVFDAVANGLH